MNKQNTTYLVNNLPRQFTGDFQSVEDTVYKKLIISQHGDQSNVMYSSVEQVDQKKNKQILQKEYDSKSIRYANEDYSYISNLLLSRFSSQDSISQIATLFPLFKMLRGIVKKLMLNELEIIFFLHTLEEQKWRYDDSSISEFEQFFKQDFLSNSEIQNAQSYKKLLLYLLCCGYTIKCFFNDANDQEIILITEHIQSYALKDFKKFIDQWRQKYMNGSLKAVPRVVNKLYNKLMRMPKEGKIEQQQDYNSLVDQIIQISPPYQNQELKQIKQEQKQQPINNLMQQPIQASSQMMNFSQQSMSMGNQSNMFVSLPGLHPQALFTTPFMNNNEFLDSNRPPDDHIFDKYKTKIEDNMPPPPPLLSQSSNCQYK